MTLTITPLFVALFAIMNFALLFPIGPYRSKVKVAFWGGEEKLDRMVRGHGNFLEVIPIALVAMGSAELIGVDTTLLLSCGSALMLGRIIHYFSIQTNPMGRGRLIGTLMSQIVVLIMAGTILYQLYLA